MVQEKKTFSLAIYRKGKLKTSDSLLISNTGSPNHVIILTICNPVTHFLCFFPFLCAIYISRLLLATRCMVVAKSEKNNTSKYKIRQIFIGKMVNCNKSQTLNRFRLDVQTDLGYLNLLKKYCNQYK